MTNAVNTTVVYFTDNTDDKVLNCPVKNSGVQTDTVWRVKNYNGSSVPVSIGTLNDLVQQVNGDRHKTESKFFGDSLIIRAKAKNLLNGTTIYCGSHMSPLQSQITIYTCGKLLCLNTSSTLLSRVHARSYLVHNIILLPVH